MVPQQQDVPCGEVLQTPLLRPGAKIRRNRTRPHREKSSSAQDAPLTLPV